MVIPIRPSILKARVCFCICSRFLCISQDPSACRDSLIYQALPNSFIAFYAYHVHFIEPSHLAWVSPELHILHGNEEIHLLGHLFQHSPQAAQNNHYSTFFGFLCSFCPCISQSSLGGIVQRSCMDSTARAVVVRSDPQLLSECRRMASGQKWSMSQQCMYELASMSYMVSGCTLKWRECAWRMTRCTWKSLQDTQTSVSKPSNWLKGKCQNR